MDYAEKWGKDVETAVELALKDLKLSREEVEVEVLEEPTKGFLGLGSKLAKVRVTKKEEPVVVEEVVPVKEEEPVAPVEEAKEEAPAVEASAYEFAPRKSFGTIDLRSKKTPEERAAAQTSSSRGGRERNNRGRDGRNGRGRNDRRERSDAQLTNINLEAISVKPDDLAPMEQHEVLDFLRDTTENMGLALTISAECNKEFMYINLAGKDAGAIIGKRGQTLDAIQYLSSLVVNKEAGDYVRVVVDAENYRNKREKTLQQLAVRLGTKVLRTGRPVKLEPMNPYERMVIHATLHNCQDVTTRSEGEEPYRRVIIEKQ